MNEHNVQSQLGEYLIKLINLFYKCVLPDENLKKPSIPPDFVQKNPKKFQQVTEKWLGKFLTVFETETFSELSRINKFQGLADNLFLEADYFKGWLGFQIYIM